MMISEVPRRYARAIYEIAKEKNLRDQVFAELRGLNTLFKADKKLGEFLETPLIKAQQKETIISEAFNSENISDVTKSFLKLLASKNRLGSFPEIVMAYQEQSDSDHGVSRGVVTSATTLSPEEQKSIEENIKKVTKREVILSYKEDPTLIGGLVAKVGSWTFDDSIESHIRRLNEELKRRTH